MYIMWEILNIFFPSFFKKKKNHFRQNLNSSFELIKLSTEAKILALNPQTWVSKYPTECQNKIVFFQENFNTGILESCIGGDRKG